MSKRNNKVSTLLDHLQGLLMILCLLLVNLILQAQPQLEIWEIQGSDNISPVLGQLVQTNDNVVTAVGEDFFFIQTPTERTDNDPLTSDGLFIYTGFTPNLNEGQLVNVEGIVREFEGLTEISGFELSFSASGGSAPIPAPVELTTTFPGTEASLVRDLERVENMMIVFDAAVVGPALGNDITALSTAAERPMREAGIRFPGLDDLPVWDGNPEVFWIDPDAISQPNNRFLSVGQRVSSTSVLYQNDDLYVAFPLSYTVSGSIADRNLRTAAADEVTVGSFNVLQLQDESDFLSTQYSKVARYIVEQLGAPDIVALQEVGDIGNLQELNFRINQLDPDLRYNTYLIQGNNNTRINCAYLVNEDIQDVDVRQLGSTETLSIGGRLHDRPPLLLEANLPTNPPTPIQVLNLHLRSLSGIEGSNSFFVRTKRYEQSLSVAQMIQERQGQNLIVVGDFNAIPFSDGYVDVLSQLEGSSSLGAQFEVQPIVSPALTNQSTAIAAESYSFVFEGNAQLLDHCLTTQLSEMEISEFAFARGNADAASAYFVNPSLSIRASDHDGFVLYLRPEAPLVNSTTGASSLAMWRLPNPVQSEARLVIPTEADIEQLQLFAINGQLLQEWSNPVPEIHLPPLSAGIYVLRFSGATQQGALKLIVD